MKDGAEGSPIVKEEFAGDVPAVTDVASGGTRSHDLDNEKDSAGDVG